ncbi:hypothetical protein FOG50_00219 [Hanseniaspora uvarum]|nr:hypothetical protein FOG50_00219 [Hanseniaspora uvarum]
MVKSKQEKLVLMSLKYKATINKTLESLKTCTDINVIKSKLYLLLNFLVNMKKDLLSEKTEDERKYSLILKDLYTKLYKKDIVIVLLITQFYIKNMHDYIPYCFEGLITPILTEGFIGPISFNKIINSMFINSDGINKKEVDRLFVNKNSQIFDICDFWLSFDLKSFDNDDVLREDHPALWEISALHDCTKIPKIDLFKATPIEKFFITKQLPLLLNDKTVLTEVEDGDLMTKYAELTENNFLKHYIEKRTNANEQEELNLKLIMNIIPIMEVLDHADESFQDNQHFVTLLSHGLSSIIEYLKHGEFIDVLKIHSVLTNNYMKSNYTFLAVLEMCKSILIIHNMEQLDNINFDKFSTLLPLSFYKDILPNIPTQSKHEIWKSAMQHKNIVSSSSRFASINFCIFLIQRLIHITLDCYNNLQVDIDMNDQFHSLLAKTRFLEIYYFKQLSHLSSSSSTDSLACFDNVFADSHRRIVYLNSIEFQLAYFENWSIENASTSLSENFESFIKFFVFDIWDEHPELKFLTQTIVVELFLNDLMSRNKTFSTYLRQGINFKYTSHKKLLNTNTQDNVGIGKLMKTIIYNNEDLEKVNDLLEDMKKKHLAITKTTQRLSLKPISNNIYTTPEKSSHLITSPKTKSFNINDLKLKTENLELDDVAPQSAIIHPL